MRHPRLFWFVLFCLLLAAGPVPLAVDGATDAHALYAQWLGVSSWIISRGRDVVDPFFSRPPLLEVAVSVAFPRFVRSFGYDAERINDVLPELPRETRLVLLSHGHYDHLMDVAYYLKRKSGQGVRYVGSATVRNVLLGFKPAALDFWTAERGGSTARGAVRVTAFPGDHAPLVDGIHLMTGEWAEPMPSFPTTAGEYREGQTQVYFVDFLDGAGAVRWRVFVNGAASAPDGARALAERPDIVRQARTNVAILCVPGWDRVDALLAEGRALFHDQGCDRCHSLGRIGARRSQDELVRYLRNAVGQRLTVHAEKFKRLSQAQVQALGAYLASLR